MLSMKIRERCVDAFRIALIGACDRADGNLAKAGIICDAHDPTPVVITADVTIRDGVILTEVEVGYVS
jgi:hypothetical protein